jgi:hypothetical protein
MYFVGGKYSTSSRERKRGSAGKEKMRVEKGK